MPKQKLVEKEVEIENVKSKMEAVIDKLEFELKIMLKGNLLLVADLLCVAGSFDVRESLHEVWLAIFYTPNSQIPV